jgi:hypothetical protein
MGLIADRSQTTAAHYCLRIKRCLLWVAVSDLKLWCTIMEQCHCQKEKLPGMSLTTSFSHFVHHVHTRILQTVLCDSSCLQTRREWEERRKKQSSKGTTEPEIACGRCSNVANDETTNYACQNCFCLRLEKYQYINIDFLCLNMMVWSWQLETSREKFAGMATKRSWNSCVAIFIWQLATHPGDGFRRVLLFCCCIWVVFNL